MEVVPRSVGEASRRWDDEHLHLRSAAEGIAAAPTGGFTGDVAAVAAQFTAAWQGYADAAGRECEDRADRLREVIRDYLATDDAVRADVLTLAAYLEERR